MNAMTQSNDRAGNNNNSTPTISDCAALILAGGFSNRFGSEKAGAMWRGHSLLSHVVAGVRPLVSETIAIARPEQSTSNWPVDRVIHDDLNLPPGPLRGIAAGLAVCQSAYAFVLSCDAPCLQPDLLRALYQRMTPSLYAIVPEWEGCLQPLVSLFSRRAAPLIDAFLKLGQSSPVKALSALPHSILPERECQSLDPEGLSFSNINNRDDLMVLERKLGVLPERTRCD